MVSPDAIWGGPPLIWYAGVQNLTLLTLLWFLFDKKSGNSEQAF